MNKSNIGAMQKPTSNALLSMLKSGFLILMLGFAPTSLSRAQTIIADDFDDNLLNPAIWQTTPCNSSSWLAEQNQRIEMRGRAKLVTMNPINPPVRVSIRFQLTSIDDNFYLVTRASADSVGSYCTPSVGLAATLFGQSVSIQRFGGNANGSPQTFQWAPGDWIRLTFTDGGTSALATYLNETSQATAEVHLDGITPFANPGLIVLFNRESPWVNNAYIDDFRADLPAAPFVTSFGTGCAGSNGTPALAPLSPPKLGTAFLVQASNLPTPGPSLAIGYFGFSRISWGFFSLPYELSAQGMPGCLMHVAPPPPGVVLGQVSSAGLCTWSQPLPSSPYLVGLELYFQALIPDIQAGNPLGATVTNGIEARIGW